ncbi:hypothetical protein LWI28_003704 [Acer negundo]|uniref:Reverse transcriptase domain-containing protein n=1 Tax=Acer negundo TaxID=4023 RepID=A0AAD5P5E9_ACENE|nr:hypothetical protein LWI28_003704 [Acer negundo]
MYLSTADNTGPPRSPWGNLQQSLCRTIQTTPTSITGETPNSLAFGSEVVIPTELSISTRRVAYYNPRDNKDELRGCLDEIEERRDQARIRTAHHQSKIAKYYNAKARTKRFDSGDLVLKKVIPSTRKPSSGRLGDR